MIQAIPGVEEEDEKGQRNRELEPAPVRDGIGHAGQDELPSGVAIAIDRAYNGTILSRNPLHAWTGERHL